MTENVIAFPKDKIVRESAVSIEEVEKSKEKRKMSYADGVVAEISEALFDELENYGIDVSGTDAGMSKDFIFLTDVLKSLVYRTMNIDHPIQTFVDENVAVFTNEKDYKEFLKKTEETETTEV